ncbi:hypothetical protein, partial [Ralstonia sp. 1B3]|uniref:hypothetical protein n=1 Tax=Ralstonia sp. 1B3 TaxID=2997421 RepID=UPI002FCA8B72
KRRAAGRQSFNKVCNEGLSGIFLQSSVGRSPTYGYVRHSMHRMLSAEGAGLALHNVLRRVVYVLGQRSWDVPGRFVSGAEHHDALRQRMPV